MKRSLLPALAAAVFLGGAVALPAPAEAQRPDTRAMTCQQAQAFVRQRGAVVMTTGQFTYARIVAGLGFCGGDEETQLKIAPTRDQPRCRVGLVCVPATILEDFMDRHR
jgi:hypothetical protein